MSGSVDVGEVTVTPGSLLYLGDGRTSLALTAAPDARAFLLGGEPFAEELVMWWNFVARSHEEIVAAREDWAGDTDPRFGEVRGYDGDRLPAPEMPTVRLKPRGREGRRPACEGGEWDCEAAGTCSLARRVSLVWAGARTSGTC